MSGPGPRIVDLIFESRPPRRRVLVGLAAVAAVPYALGAAAVSRAVPPPEPAPHRLPPIVIELPVVVPPPAPAAPPTRATIAPRSMTAAPRTVAARAPAPPSAAATLAAARPAGPVDLTGDVFITGEAAAPTGGVTARSGVAQAASIAASRARSVSLEATRWRCPWPKQADGSERDRETVLISVVVAATGAARSVEVLRDPGSGFGTAAVQCALATSFLPALDSDGRAIEARSPPILVRFDR